MTALLPGAALGLSLIVAIGAQNLFVLRQGARREHIGLVVAICALSDVVLIVAGVGGLGQLVQAHPGLVDVARWGGAVFLLGYAALALRRAITGGGEGLSAEGATAIPRTRRRSVAVTALALTWLNPHVYLDTVFLLGSVAATYEADRWWFAAGACVGSIAWFATLGFGARHLGRFLRTARSWRVVDGAIALVMVTIAVMLVI